MSFPEPIIIAGLGNLVAKRLARHFHSIGTPIFLVDDGLAGQTMHGLMIEPCKSLSRFGNKQDVMVCIFNPIAFDKVCEKIRAVNHTPVAIEKYVMNAKLPVELIGFPKMSDIDVLTDVESAFTDPLSLMTLKAIKEFWKTGERSCLQNITQSIHSIYFNESFLPYETEHVLVDAGAFNGDSLRSMNTFFPRIRAAHLFEPIETPIDLPINVHSEIYEVALGIETKEIRFTVSGLNSAVSQTGEAKVNQEKLDTFELDPTFIKIDVEGQDIDVLRGASTTIQKYRPVLAVSVYHRPEHLKEAIELIREEYGYEKFYLRKYSLSNDETVLYAL